MPTGLFAGWAVLTNHGGGSRTRYLHLREHGLPPDAGRDVARGEVVGFEGTTGDSTGNHLHFETRQGATTFSCTSQTSGTAVDPAGLWQDNPPNHADFSPAVATWTSSRVDVFVRGKDNDLWRRTRTGASWGNWSRPRPGDCLRSAPSASTWSTTRIDVFYRGCDNDLFQVTWNGSQWSEVRPMPGSCLLAAPAATSWGSNRIDVFYRGCDNDLFQQTWNGSQWSVSRPVPGSCLRSGPGAVAPGTNAFRLAYRGCDDGIWYYRYDGGGWYGQSLGGCTMLAPAVASWASNRVDVFHRGCGPAGSGEGVFQDSYNGSSWSGWINRGGCLASGPGSDAWAPDWLNVMYRGCDSPANMYNAYWNGGAWTHASFASWP